MKRLILALTLLFPLAAPLVHAETGLKMLSIDAPHHGREMEMAIMFPAKGGKETVLGDNAVFYGVSLRLGAKPEDGRYPVILLSHGWGGNLKRMGWLSAGLSAKGAIVVSVNHPNSTTGELENLKALNHWTRAQDLSLALDHLLQDPELVPHIEANRVYATGFSYGGWTALSLGGVKGRRDGLDRFCRDGVSISSHCRDILKAGIRIADLDERLWNASHKDPRVKAVAAIDPALTWNLSRSDVAELDVPVMIVGLGEGSSRLLATDTSASGSNFEALVPTAKVQRIAPATHFTALGLCKPAGENILRQEHDDPVCTDPPGTDRRAIASRIIDLIAKHFRLK